MLLHLFWSVLSFTTTIWKLEEPQNFNTKQSYCCCLAVPGSCVRVHLHGIGTPVGRLDQHLQTKIESCRSNIRNRQSGNIATKSRCKPWFPSWRACGHAEVQEEPSSPTQTGSPWECLVLAPQLRKKDSRFKTKNGLRGEYGMRGWGEGVVGCSKVFFNYLSSNTHWRVEKAENEANVKWNILGQATFWLPWFFAHCLRSSNVSLTPDYVDVDVDNSDDDIADSSNSWRSCLSKLNGGAIEEAMKSTLRSSGE